MTTACGSSIIRLARCCVLFLHFRAFARRIVGLAPWAPRFIACKGACVVVGYLCAGCNAAGNCVRAPPGEPLERACAYCTRMGGWMAGWRAVCTVLSSGVYDPSSPLSTRVVVGGTCSCGVCWSGLLSTSSRMRPAHARGLLTTRKLSDDAGRAGVDTG